MTLWRGIQKILGLEKKRWSAVVVTKDVADILGEMARKNHPREFSAFLSGTITDGVLVVDGVLYQHFHSSEDSALITDNLPLLSGKIGSAHSHPGGSLRPSNADRIFFAKTGEVHAIIGEPYTARTIALYDSRGRSIPFMMRQ